MPTATITETRTPVFPYLPHDWANFLSFASEPYFFLRWQFIKIHDSKSPYVTFDCKLAVVRLGLGCELKRNTYSKEFTILIYL